MSATGNAFTDSPTFPWTFHGMGGPVVGPKAAQIASIASAGAATTGALLSTLAAMPLAGPIGAGIAALIGIGVGIADLFSGCGDICTETANIDNKAEPLLLQNLNAYMTLPVPRYKSTQDAALNNFDTLWAAYEQAEQAYGSQGQLSISQRQAGACHYNPNGQCWNWFVGYRDPIANDPNVIPDPISTPSGSGTGIDTTGGSTLSNLPIVPLLIALVAVGLLMSGD